GGTGFRLAQRAVFLGTPEFAVRSLEALDRLRESGVLQIVGVVTQPDRPASRGVVREPAVKVAARAMGLSVRQPPRLDEKEVAASGASRISAANSSSARCRITLREDLSAGRRTPKK